MNQTIVRKIIHLIREAQKLALKIGIGNILQPGLIKEMIIAEKLGHQIIISKHDSDACDPHNPNKKYEYLSSYEGGTGQLDRMFKSPKEKRQKSLERITRNAKIYYAVFYRHDPLKIKVIYEVEPKVLLKEVERQLDNSSNTISHIGITENWAQENAKKVYSDMKA